LAEAAGELKMSQDYLIKLIKVGKIKAFKVGQDWFIEENWLDDFKSNLRKDLDFEAEKEKLIDYSSKFVRKIRKSQRQKEFSLPVVFLVNEFFKVTVSSLALVLLSFVFCGVLFLIIIVDNNKTVIASSFISTTNEIYTSPLAGYNYLQLVSKNSKINDEVLTEFAGVVFDKVQFSSERLGQVAGEMEVKEK
jgi:hypothetical protein